MSTQGSLVYPPSGVLASWPRCAQYVFTNFLPQPGNTYYAKATLWAGSGTEADPSHTLLNIDTPDGNYRKAYLCPPTPSMVHLYNEQMNFSVDLELNQPTDVQVQVLTNLQNQTVISVAAAAAPEDHFSELVRKASQVISDAMDARVGKADPALAGSR